MECFYLIKDYRILSYFFINITFFYSTDCEECKLEYVDNCLIHPLIPMHDTQVRTIAHCDSVGGPIVLVVWLVGHS